MTLPGKVTIGYLEEDLPQKAYFRIKPLFVSGDGVFERVEDARGEFPDEGGVRIVPDKNESSRFKARMRTLGRYCALDLRQHPAENDKIRPNKNYNPDRSEFNRNIVYSDVVTECRTEWLMEVVRAEKTAEGVVRAILPRRPGTRRVAVVLDGEVSAPWHAQAGEAEGEAPYGEAVVSGTELLLRYACETDGGEVALLEAGIADGAVAYWSLSYETDTQGGM